MEDHRANAELQRLADVLHCAIAKQLHRPRAIVDADHDLRSVDIEGRIDLVKVAEAIATRCCVRMSAIETIGEALSK